MASDNRLAAALAYAAHGWHVFPLRGKLPAKPKIEGGRGFYDAATDPATVHAMWKRYPRANIGIRTGAASGLAVLDVDPAAGGADTLTRIETQHGVLPATVMAITGGNGLHMLYRHHDGIGCGAGVWGPGLDLRGEGGYIVAAPSVHPVTRQAYAWSGDGTWTVELSAWPELQLPLAKPETAPSVIAPFRPRGHGGILAGLVQFVLDAPQGERNTRLNWSAHRAGEHVRNGRLDAREVTPALLLAAQAVGLGEREATRTVESGLVSGLKSGGAA